MHAFLFTLGIFLMAMSAVHCGAIRKQLRQFTEWALRMGAPGWIVYAWACGLLVATITFPWDYLL